MTQTQPSYEITQDGKVFSVSSNWRGYGKREMVQQLNAHGYPSVRLIINGKRKRVAVHKLVAIKFLGAKPSPAYEVCHIDGNRLNNDYKNLRWGTRKDNADDREKHGRTSRGERHSILVKNGISKAKGGS